MAEIPQDGELDPRFSAPNAVARPWSEARDILGAAKTYWLSTVRPDGRPHVTTISAIWQEEEIYFSTNEAERKGKNLAANPKVVVTTGCNGWDGLDTVLEGEAVAVTDPDRLRRFCEAMTEKYDDFFQYRFEDGVLTAAGESEGMLVFEVRPDKAFGFAKGETFGQTRWRWRD